MIRKILITLIIFQTFNSICLSCLFSRRKPVCGDNGQTYENSCQAECNGIVVIANGECVVQGDPSTCVCSKEENWVCGKDGNNYKNLCLMKCSGVELDFEGLCDDKTSICTQGCNTTAINVPMLLKQPIGGSNITPNFCTAFCDAAIGAAQVLSVAGQNGTFDFIAEQNQNGKFCQSFPQNSCPACEGQTPDRCGQCDTCVGNGNTGSTACLNRCRECAICKFDNGCIDNTPRSKCLREVRKDTRTKLTLAQCGCPNFENPQCGIDGKRQYRNTCHLLCNFDKASGANCPGKEVGDGEICDDDNQASGQQSQGQQNSGNQIVQCVGSNCNGGVQQFSYQNWLKNQYMNNRNAYLGISINQNTK